MAQAFNFHPEWHETKDGNWGTIDVETGVWNGMVGEVYRGEADIAAAGLSVSYQREQVIDYLYPYKEESLGVLVREVDLNDRLLTAAFHPFSFHLWLTILAAAMVVALLLWLTSSLGLTPDPLARSLPNALWYAATAFFSQGQYLQARATSVRCIAGAWLFCCVVLYATYSATLTASLTVSHKKMPFSTLEEMVKQTEYKYGVYRSGLAGLIFETADSGIYKDVFDGIRKDERNFVGGKDGVQRVRDEKFAYISDASYLEIQTIKECHIRLIKEKFYKTGFAFAVPHNWPYTREFDLLMMQLRENGLVARWIKEEFPPLECDLSEAYFSVKQISLEGISSSLLILLLGIVVASLTLFTEHKLRNTKGRIWSYLLIMPKPNQTSPGCCRPTRKQNGEQ